MTAAQDGRRRVVIESVLPCVDCGGFPVKRVVGERVTVEADVFTDGHDLIACVVRHRCPGEPDWRETEMRALGNDRWRARFKVDRLGRYEYTIAAWIDRFATWRQELARRQDPVDVAAALEVGAVLLREAGQRADPLGNADRAGRAAPDAERLESFAAALAGAQLLESRLELALSGELAALALRYPDRRFEAVHEPVLEVVVDRKRARFSAWYELFPRSLAHGAGLTASEDARAHGTFKTAAARVPYVAGMGFDVLYLPPIHPIGRTHRKGRNNSLTPEPGDPGSPWAIGAEEGGHKSVHPALGTLEDFRALCAEAERHGIDVALDIALQCSPDHPYVREHPEWFRRRPDGSIQYAENPPKKYEDIFPFDFDCDEWQALWSELASIFKFWVEQGVKVFRVDNPHTKPFGFWRWVIAEIKRDHPEVLFLAEAFTRPRVMHRLAKLGFTQSYTYFTWRNTKHELVEYLGELAASREYFRPNFWPNTPDILHEYLQFGGRPAFMCRAVLAATLAASWGIYGPAYELLEAVPRDPGTEEYLDSEKYQLREWDLDEPASLSRFLSRLNRLRRENAALQSDTTLTLRPIDNDQLIAYTKTTEDLGNIILVVANLDPHHVQSGYVEIPLAELGIPADRPYQVHDLLSEGRYLWQGARNYIALDPQRSPAHVFRLRRHLRTERDFDYFL
jgi:starch synthase (maltosyl-transferring)